MHYTSDQLPYNVTFTPIELEVVQAATAERIQKYMKFNQPVPKDDITIMGVPAQRPYLIISKLEGVAELGNRLLKYAVDTDYSTENIVLYAPSDEVARPMIADRQRLGITAMQVGDELLMTADVLATLKAIPELPETENLGNDLTILPWST